MKNLSVESKPIKFDEFLSLKTFYTMHYQVSDHDKIIKRDYQRKFDHLSDSIQIQEKIIDSLRQSHDKLDNEAIKQQKFI